MKTTDIRDAADDFYSGLRVKSGFKEDICIEDQRDGREFWGDGNELDVYNTLCDWGVGLQNTSMDVWMMIWSSKYADFKCCEVFVRMSCNCCDSGQKTEMAIRGL